jgi:hypothetical protein
MKINITDKEKIQKAINNAEGKARERVLYYANIETAIVRAEKKLSALEIPKRAWFGCSVILEPEKVPNSYRNIPKGTWAEIKRFASGWFLVKCYRGNSGSCSYGSGPTYRLNITPEAKAAIPDRITL